MRNFIKLILVGSTSILAACATSPVQYTENNVSALTQDLLQSAPLPEGFEASALSLEKTREMAIKLSLIHI